MNNADGAANPPHISGVLPEDMKKYIESHPFANIDELRTYFGQHAKASNEAALDDFDGLTASQMHAFLNFKEGDETIVRFPLAPAGNFSAPILDIFLAIATIVDRQPCKATAKGRLPRSLCREAALTVLSEDEYKERTRFGGINMEEDYPELHTTRIVAMNSRLLCSDGKKFSLSAECRMLIEKMDHPGIYQRLLTAYVLGFNWGYRDRYPDYTIIQRSFLFSLYLLQRYGAQKRESEFYEEAFLRAFPAVLKEAPPENYQSPEESVMSAYTLRTIHRFFTFFGLANINEAERDLLEECDVTATSPFIPKRIFNLFFIPADAQAA